MKGLLFLLVATFTLSGCAKVVEVKVPDKELDPTYRTGRGSVQLLPCTAGKWVKEVKPGVINLDPYHFKYGSTDYFTRDNLTAVITETIANGLSQAGFTVLAPSSQSQPADMVIGCEVIGALMTNEPSFLVSTLQYGSAFSVLLGGLKFYSSSSDPAAIIAVKLDYHPNTPRPKRSREILSRGRSLWGVDTSFKLSLENLQERAVTETLKAAGIIAP